MVDFGTLPGGVQVVCVTGSVTSGFDALQRAGFTWTGTQRFPSLVCRIDGEPSDDPCVTTPPANRYWSYWTAATPGGAWVYSDQGAGTRTPPPGSVDGWAFVDGCDRTPGSGPCPGSTTTTAHLPASTTTSVASTATTAVATTSATTGGSNTTAASSGGVTPAPPGSSTTTSSAARVTAPAAGSVSSGDGAPAAGGPADAGSPAGALVVGGIVLTLGSLAARRARRRGAGDER